MAEAAGLALGTLALASLFQTCVDFFETVEVAQSLEFDRELTVTKINLLRARLRQWGGNLHVHEPGREAVALRENWLQDGEVITQSLLGIHHMLGSSSRVMDKYEQGGEKKASIWSLFSSSREPHNIASTRPITPSLNSQNSASLLRKQASWAIRDKKKLDSLILEIDFLITNLEKIGRRILPIGTVSPLVGDSHRAFAANRRLTLDKTGMSQSNNTQARDSSNWAYAPPDAVSSSRSFTSNYRHDSSRDNSALGPEQRPYALQSSGRGAAGPVSSTASISYHHLIQMNSGDSFHHSFAKMVAAPRSFQHNGDHGITDSATRKNQYNDVKAGAAAVQINGNSAKEIDVVELFKIAQKSKDV